VNVSTIDLAIAWRKAKVDLYYSTNPQLLDRANKSRWCIYSRNGCANTELKLPPKEI
jgi:hypothetical protein